MSDPAAVTHRSRRLSTQSAVLFTCVLAIAVFALHYDVLTAPPAIEQARGLWLQAAYLADTNFDYHRLETEEPGPEKFSAYSYERFKTSLPALLAAMMLVLPSPQAVIVAYRLLTFLATALVAAMVYGIVRPHTGRALGFLLIAALLTNPVFSVQTEMLGMEIPLALASVGVAWCLAYGRVGWSAVFALAAVAVKMSGAIAPLALVGSLALVAASGRGWKAKLITWSGVLLAGALLYVVLARFGAHRNQFLWNDLRSGAPVLCPDLGLLLGITLAVWSLAQLRHARSEKPVGNSRVNSSRVGLYCGLFIALQIMVCDNVSFLVRYLTPTIPLLFVLLAMAASHVRWVNVVGGCGDSCLECR